MKRKGRYVLSTLLISAFLTAMPYNAMATIVDVEISEANFPDEVFRGYVSRFDKNNNGSLSVNEISSVSSMDVHNMQISDLTGIEYFESLESLDCGENEITKLDVSHNANLFTLKCNDCNLTSLTLSNYPYLQELDCSGNTITELDLDFKPNLKYLNCRSNNLNSLDISNNKKLMELYCDNNQLTELILLQNPDLISLSCEGNSFSKLNISINTTLIGHVDHGTKTEIDNVLKYERFGLASGWISFDADVTLIMDKDFRFGWQEIDGNKYYYNEDGVPLTGAQIIGVNKYFFDKNGVLQTGVLKRKGKVYYLNPDYNGAMQTGWLTLDGKTYFFNDDGEMLTGAQQLYGQTYYFNSNGTLKTGVLKTSKGVYYLNPDNNGAMHTGWLDYKGARYYFDENGKMVTGVKKIDEKTYYFAKNGQMQTGILKLKGKVFYLGKNGSLHIGWLNLKGKRYYMQKDGSLAVSCTINIDGKEYTFNEKGLPVGDEPVSEQDKMAGAKVGDIVSFGNYEQDNNINNGKEAVEWIVLDRDSEGGLLLISRYALDCHPFQPEVTNTSSESWINWQNCDLRSWLNGTFSDEAFSIAEKALIRTTSVTYDTKVYAEDDSGTIYEGGLRLVKGEITDDQLFVLDYDEANEYFKNDKSRICYPTKYAITQGADPSGTWWWLRSLGFFRNCAGVVFENGWVGPEINCMDYDGNYKMENEDGDIIDYKMAVRPALWVQP